MALTHKPNISVDYDNLPPLALNNPRIRALIEQSKRDNQRRFRRSTRSVFNEAESTNDQDYYPSLYEQDAEIAPEFTYILAETYPKDLDNVSNF